MEEKMYTVSIYTTPLSLPLSVATHAYIVTQHNGTINRYDLIKPGNKIPINSYDGLLFKNLLSLEGGFSIFHTTKPKYKQLRWSSKHHMSTSGTENSQAHQLYTFIEAGGLQTYPHKNYYRMFRGPNSNTFIQWVIDQIPGTGLSLPWNAWGKGCEY